MIKSTFHRLKGEATLQRRQPKHYIQNTNAAKKNILLLSGWSTHWSFIRHLGNSLARHGHSIYVLPELKRNLISIPEAAALIKNMIDKKDLKNVYIIGFSKGGLIAKYLLAYHNKPARINSVITIATPYDGARLANLFPYRSVKELSSDSQVIRDLQKQTAVNSQITAISASKDEVIGETAELAGAKNICVECRGHHKVIFDKKVEEIILRELA